jgi:hypothetical protein
MHGPRRSPTDRQGRLTFGGSQRLHLMVSMGDRSACTAVTLARAHYVEDFTGVGVKDSSGLYPATPSQMPLLKNWRARYLLDHITRLGDLLYRICTAWRPPCKGTEAPCRRTRPASERGGSGP